MERLNLPNPRNRPPAADVEQTSDDLRHDMQRLRQTCEELQADLEWLAGEVKSLRGHITGGLRKEKKDNGQQPTQMDVNEAIKAGVFVRRR